MTGNPLFRDKMLFYSDAFFSSLKWRWAVFHLPFSFNISSEAFFLAIKDFSNMGIIMAASFPPVAIPDFI